MAHIGSPDLFTEEKSPDKINISVAFSWDLPLADKLYKEWSKIAPTEIGGPATGIRSENFIPGMYLKYGYVITSRGCPNRCWYCNVWRREGETVRELPITNGWNVLDDNLLACSDEHIRGVFAMLSRQKKRPLFTGGLEPARLQKWYVEELAKLHPDEMFFAYDTPDDREPLFEAGKLLLNNGFSRKRQNLRVYVLVGFPGDTFDAAKKRLTECMQAGFIPMAMLYRDKIGDRDPAWVKFAWPWIRPAAMSKKYRAFESEDSEI
jgi:hypothetical protein